MRPLDRLILGYLAAAAALVAFGSGPVQGRAELLLGFCGCAALVLVCAWGARHRPAGCRALAYATICYPLVLPLFLYPAVGRYALVLRGRYLDGEINSWELDVFGVHPNVWMDTLASPPLTEFMMTSYFAFYLFAAAPSVWLVSRGRTEDAEDVLFRQMLTVCLCYLGHLLVPLRGPALTFSSEFQPPTLSGYLMTSVQTWIMTRDPVGACFPSNHVATTWATLFAVHRTISARWACSLVPFVLCVTVAVVYNRYHYVSDAFAGIAVAVFASVLTTALRSRSLFPFRFPSRSPRRGHLQKMP